MATADPWSFLRKFTHARIGLGRFGHSIPTKEVLDFRLAFARARDSVLSEVDFQKLSPCIPKIFENPILVKSNCKSKEDFLRNPLLGRQLSEDSKDSLRAYAAQAFDSVLIIADGLSANAIHRTAQPFITDFLERCKNTSLRLAPVIFARYARVALGDEIGSLLNAKTTVVLIGERPGLGSADSLSVYFTYAPNSKNTDAQRNCISNIHRSGLSPEVAAMMTEYLLTISLRKKLSGVSLKVEYPALAVK